MLQDVFPTATSHARPAADADFPVAPTAAHFWLDHGTAFRLGRMNLNGPGWSAVVVQWRYV